MRVKFIVKPTKNGLFRAFFTDKNGKRHYASDYGHKAWPIGKRKR